jgi:hypothetical protein
MMRLLFSNDYEETFGPTLKLSKNGTIEEVNNNMSRLQLLKKELSISQILRIYGMRFKQIKKKYSDELDGRCAIGIIMSYFGWNGKHDSDASNSLQTALHILEDAGIRSGVVIKLNDSGKTFIEIADYIDLNNRLTKNNSNQ